MILCRLLFFSKQFNHIFRVLSRITPEPVIYHILAKFSSYIIDNLSGLVTKIIQYSDFF